MGPQLLIIWCVIGFLDRTAHESGNACPFFTVKVDVRRRPGARTGLHCTRTVQHPGVYMYAWLMFSLLFIWHECFFFLSLHHTDSIFKSMSWHQLGGTIMTDGRHEMGHDLFFFRHYLTMTAE
jgi:hypothetical protein